MKKGLVLLGVLVGIVACNQQHTAREDHTQWNSYLGGADRNHFSRLSQINPDNVSQLQQAWSYAAPDWGQMQMSPIVVDSILYGVTAATRVVALNAASGREIWQFGDTLNAWHSTSRGVAFWKDGRDQRVFCTRGPKLYALDALSGKPIPSFGNKGQIDLRSGMEPEAQNRFVVSNTPGTVYQDRIIMPLRVAEDAGGAPGDITAFNVRTGAVEWVFHTLPLPNEAGNETWEDPKARFGGIVGGANNWAGMALDEASGVLYVPTGSAAPDFYGGFRKGQNLYANCLLALDAATGKLLWHFQFTHHDLWDRDPPAPPNLITVTRGGEQILAVAQVTKQGYVFVFDRKTGQPLFDIEEVPVPASSLEGEKAWTTQPIPVAPKPFARQSQDLGANDISPYAQNPDSLREILVNVDKRQYAPPNTSPVLLLPGYDGGAEWGGAGADPDAGILYVNSNEMAWFLQLRPMNADLEHASLGGQLYASRCARCHQTDRKGLPESGFPSLIHIGDRLSKSEILQTVVQGKGMMTGFPDLSATEKEGLYQFLTGQDKEASPAPMDGPVPMPYQHTGYHKFLDSNGLPAISPPWGQLHAIDLNTGDYLWSIPYGGVPELAQLGVTDTGSESYGGPVITENGLLFIAGTKDGFLRAYNRHTGALLWKQALPAPAFATPATYYLNGKQYVVVACGGEKLGAKKGNQIVAFALP